MTLTEKFENYFNRKDVIIGKVVDFEEGEDELYPFDFTANNTDLNAALVADTDMFSAWVAQKLRVENCSLAGTLASL